MASNKNVFIIGNGFDLNLGLNTSYESFYYGNDWEYGRQERGYVSKLNQEFYVSESIDNTYGRNVNQENSLYKTLDNYPVDDWCEAENVIQDFAINMSENSETDVDKLKNNEEEFDLYRQRVRKFIEHSVTDPYLKAQSCAAQTLMAIIKKATYKIYNFNYTKLEDFASLLKIKGDIDCENVHGTIDDPQIIMGANGKVALAKGYDILKKMYCYGYSTHNISYDLQHADQVIIFGYSMTPIDEIYFKEFLMKQVSCKEEERKTITFITKNDEARHKLLRNIQSLIDNNAEELFQRNNVRIFMTESLDEKRFKEFLKNI